MKSGFQALTLMAVMVVALSSAVIGQADDCIPLCDCQQKVEVIGTIDWMKGVTLQPLTKWISGSIKGPNNGGVKEGVIVKINKELDLYRLYDTEIAKPSGGWWTLTAPAGKKSDFRRDYEICSQWNKLTKLRRCKAKIGSIVIMGPGQSMSCPNGEQYGESKALQVFVADPDKDIDLASCQDSVSPLTEN